jgi:protease-4
MKPLLSRERFWTFSVTSLNRPILMLALATSAAIGANTASSTSMAMVDPDGIRSLLSNPAGLGLMQGRELALQWGADSPIAGQSAFLAGIPHLGVGLESQSAGYDQRSSHFLIGTGATVKNLSAGLLASRPVGDRETLVGCAAPPGPCASSTTPQVWSADLGLLWRPSPRLSLGMTIPDLFEHDPSRDRTNTVGLGLRPLGTPALAVSAEASLSPRPWSPGAWNHPTWELGAKFRPLEWIELDGHLDPEHPDQFGFGARLQMNPATTFFANATSVGSGPGFQTVGVRFSERTRPSFPTQDAVLVYHLANPESESPTGPFWKHQPGFLSLRDDFRRMAGMTELRTVVLDLGSNRFSPTRAGVLRRLVLDLKRHGKQVWAWSNDLDMSSLQILSAADKAAISPEGAVRARGLAMDVLYFGKILKRHGIEVQVVKTGPWKSAMEPYERDSMSTPARDNLSRILSDIDSMIVSNAATSRKIDPKALRAYIDTGSLLPSSAVALRLVDTLLDRDSLSHWAKGRKLSSRIAGTQTEAWGSPRRVAVVVLEGQIVDKAGETGMIPWNKSLVAESIAARLDGLRRDPSIAAVVLRIQSPGGSVAGSERLRRAVERLAQDKPVIASIGHTAASGGYMLALGANRIFSEPEALVGSIGVFAAKPSIAGLLDSLGIKAERVRTAPHAGATSLYAALDSLELSRMTEYIEDSHRKFDDEVMRARRFDTAALHKVDGGRVFSGVRALGLGLVDTLGGLEEALAWTRTRAGVRPETTPVLFDARTSDWITEGMSSLAGPIPSDQALLLQTWKTFSAARPATLWAQSAWEPLWE